MFTCTGCKSVSYCQKKCQHTNWKTHKKICKRLNPGDAKQATHLSHTLAGDIDEDVVNSMILKGAGGMEKEFYDLFLNSQDQTKGEMPLIIKKMEDCFLPLSKCTKQNSLFEFIKVLMNLPTKLVELPTSPLSVTMKQMSAKLIRLATLEGESTLHKLAEGGNPLKERSLKNQVIIGRQLILAGCNVNARCGKNLKKMTVLHKACHSSTHTNLAFIKLLLDNGADPNARNSFGETPIMYTLDYSTGAAKFLLEYSNKTDPNIFTNAGRSLLACLRKSIKERKARKNRSDKQRDRYLVQQLIDLEAMLVERGAIDNGKTGFSYGIHECQKAKFINHMRMQEKRRQGGFMKDEKVKKEMDILVDKVMVGVEVTDEELDRVREEWGERVCGVPARNK